MVDLGGVESNDTNFPSVRIISWALSMRFAIWAETRYSHGQSMVVVANITLVHYLPIGTTLIATAFFLTLLRRRRSKGEGIHLLWWAVGVLTYGMGTALESLITLTGNSVLLNKLWYVMGAVLGAYPLAQGTVYLLLRRRAANRLSVLTLPLVVALIALVIFCPVNAEALDPIQPSGSILGWSWLRAITPLINGYAALFLVGGAFFSSWQYFRRRTQIGRAIGNAFIAVGALLPGIGGVAAKTGRVEVLYITELFGLMLIWLGYWFCVRPQKQTDLPSMS